MPLHPIAEAILQQIASQPAMNTLPVDVARERMVEFAKAAGPGEDVASVSDRHIATVDGDVSVRIYRPTSEGSLPALIYFHGGGWTLGNLDTDDAFCRAICNAVQCVVVSVNYRHAPEHKFPTAVQDAYAATCWVADNAGELGVDSARLAVGGSSAGGNLAAVVTLMAREKRTPRILYQVLRLPVTNYDFETRSYRECGEGYGLERRSMEWFWNNYLNSPADGLHPHASPLKAGDLSGLPPALVQTAEYDPLRDEGRAYARRLMEAGVQTTDRCYEGMMHLYMGEESMQDIARHLRQAFA